MNALESLKNRYRVNADPLRSERRVELIVVVLAAILLLQLLWSGLRILLAGEVAPVTPAADSLMVVDVPRPQSVNAQDSAAVQARPLFWASRRPRDVLASAAAQNEEPEEEPAAPKMKNVKLLGVFGSGESGGAIVAVKGRQERVSVGESVQDWRLQEVAANRALFVSGGSQDERELLPRVIAPPVDAAGDVIAPGAGQGSGDAAADADEEEPRLSLGGR